MPDPNLPILIASRSPALAEGLRSFLRGLPVQAVVCHTAHRALTLVEEGSPALLIVDWHLADAQGIELALELSRREQMVPMLFCVEPGSFRAGQEAQAAAVGAVGALLVTATREAVIEAVSDAIDRPFAAGVARNVGELVERTAPRRVLLTPQERVVLRLMRQQLTYKEIALEISVSWHTVRSHAQSILRKMGIHSRRELETWDSRLGVQDDAASTLQEVAA